VEAWAKDAEAPVDKVRCKNMLDNTATLQELLNFMQRMQSDQADENELLKRRLIQLEGKRHELIDHVSSNIPDDEYRHKLDETEKQLKQTRKTLLDSENNLRTTLADLRQRILKTANDELTRLENENRELRQRREAIQHQLFPEIRERLTRLEEEESDLNERSEAIGRRIRELSTIDLEKNEVA
jgi:hypothetical protein